MSFLILDAGAASSLTLVSGNNQSAEVGHTLPGLLTVRALDANGTPVGGVSVTFAVTAGGGALIGTPGQTTDVNGYASIQWTMGSIVGTAHLTATALTLSGSPATFTATAEGSANVFRSRYRYAGIGA